MIRTSFEEFKTDYYNWKTLIPHFDYSTIEKKQKEERTVFLTGATGFLGGFLLAQLLRTTNYHIWCLVRAGDADSGMAKVKSNLEQLGIFDDTKFHGRVKVCYLLNNENRMAIHLICYRLLLEILLFEN